MSFKFHVNEVVLWRRKKAVILARKQASGMTIYRLHLGEDSPTWATEDELKKADHFCIACCRPVETANGLTVKHDHDGKICYGSFVPTGEL